ncbi:type III-A CRISPR-associated RAMP protein Csm3 [Persephonella sp.]
MNLNYQGTYIIKAKLKCITGLHIGGSKESFEIGGIDNPVIKTPLSLNLPDGREIKEGMPYIPGSSLKGKMRSLLEWQYGLVKPKVENGKIKSKFIPVKLDNNKELNDVAVVFGVGAKLDGEFENVFPQPVRIKVYDAYPSKDTIKKWEEELGAGLYTEIKTENAIDRITSVANPRQQERVPAGSEFEVEIVYEVFEDEDHKRLKLVFEGMQRLQDNFLGGGGSRGNGRVQFENIKVIYKDRECYEGKKEPEVKIDQKNLEEIIKTLASGGQQ